MPTPILAILLFEQASFQLYEGQTLLTWLKYIFLNKHHLSDHIKL